MTTTNEGTQRDELVSLLWCKPFPYGGAGAYIRPDANASHAMANAILAAGYRKPRTITTAEELDALPDGAIYLSGHREVMRANGAGWDPSNLDSGGLADPADITLPATVIWEPEVLVAA